MLVVASLLFFSPPKAAPVQLGAASLTMASANAGYDPTDYVSTLDGALAAHGEGRDAVDSPDTDTDSESAGQTPAQTRAARRSRRLGGFRLARFGVAAKTGYTHGTSATSGLFSRDQSLQDSLSNASPTLATGGSGSEQYGGFQSGFILDAEVVGLNLWLDFHKFYTPGGMWSLLLGYDHEFGFGRRVRLDVGAGGGVSHMFFGQLAAAISNPLGSETSELGAAGLEARASADLHIKLIGPLYTGPSAMVGYHYLWAASTSDVTVERGLHYSFGWTLRLDLATPRLGSGRRQRRAR